VTETTIDKITKDSLGNMVKLNGIVNRITQLNTTSFIELTQPSKMDVVVFKEEQRNLTIEQGDQVEIIGNIDEYDGKLEIIAERIRVIR
jgi:aspartyl/asparaginyl-tRNA synthetase